MKKKTGIILSFSLENGFGKIKPTLDDDPILFHKSQILEHLTLQEGTKVEYFKGEYQTSNGKKVPGAFKIAKASFSTPPSTNNSTSRSLAEQNQVATKDRLRDGAESKTDRHTRIKPEDEIKSSVETNNIKPNNTSRPAQKQRGTIKNFNSERGFGFIVPESGGDDLFIHISNIEGNKPLLDQEKVEYRIGEGKDGRPIAIDVNIVVTQNSHPSSENSIQRLQGWVTFFDLGSAFGFIRTSKGPKDYFVHKNDIIDGRPLFEGEEVEFTPGRNEKGLTASDVSRSSPSTLPSSGKLFEWADFGDISNILLYLEEKALKENWKYKNTPENPDRPLPILYNYLKTTFERLVLESATNEHKIMVSNDGSYAAFNTGLVNDRYKTLFALFTPNREWGPYWKIKDFCVDGERGAGQILTANFNPTPQVAHYFEKPDDLIYDSRESKPALSSDHIIIDNIDRFPPEFIQEHCPPNFMLRNTSGMEREERKKYYLELGRAIENDARTYRTIEKRLNDAVDLAILKVTWNYKTAIPQYYPPTKKLQLLLPLCLVSDERVDLALAVDRKESGAYLGHTVLPLDWAYRNARLICRPDSDWLTPDSIVEGVEDSTEN